MRLKSIENEKIQAKARLATLPAQDGSDRVVRRAVKPTTLRQRTRDLIADPSLRLISSLARRSVFRDPCEVHFDAVAINMRFAQSVAKQRFLGHVARLDPKRVLAVGTGDGQSDAEFFAKHCRAEFYGIEFANFRSHWLTLSAELKAEHARDFHFHQMDVGQLSFPDAHFDLITSSAVLEHLVDFDRAVEEMARVHRTGGIAMHDFGPLYFSLGGDHCCGVSGSSHGYEHLLLTDTQYVALVDKVAHGPNGDHAFWAKNGFFSYLKVSEYFQALGKYYDFDFAIASVPLGATNFRRSFPAEWSSLRAAGLSELDLLVDGVWLVLRRNSTEVPRPR